jgi:uncharacterized protein
VIVFVDTSAFYAVLDGTDANHVRARETWVRLLTEDHILLTTNYVLIETCALLQSRLGMPAVRAFHEDVVPLLQVDWISEDRHKSGVEAALAASRRRLSIVDCISFQSIRERGVRRVFCFDRHFGEQGFDIVPK